MTVKPTFTQAGLLLIGVIWAIAMTVAPGAARAQASAPQLSDLRPGADYVPGELVVALEGSPERELELPAGVGIAQAAGALAQNPNVAYAVPNYVADAAAACPPSPAPDPFPECPPNDAAAMDGSGDWRTRQWNFLTDINDDPVTGDQYDCPLGVRCGINALGAWKKLVDIGRAGASGVRIAVVDSGIAYRKFGTRFKRSPDFRSGQFATGYDFVGRDTHPLDLYGHGTHVAGTIAQKVNNGVALTGLAYNARIIPVRVLDGRGRGSASQVARGIRYAADRNADIINLSFDFPAKLGSSDLRGVHKAINYANARGALIVAAAGNERRSRIPYPAAGPKVIAVAASTVKGCLASYSNRGNGATRDRKVDVAAPGGGADDGLCTSPLLGGRPIYQVTVKPRRGNFTRFGIPGSYVGTSQAAAHVSGVAAMVLATGVLGSNPTQSAQQARLRNTGSPLRPPFGYVNLIDATQATTAP